VLAARARDVVDTAVVRNVMVTDVDSCDLLIGPLFLSKA
jgi:hypothetical protein